MLTISADTTLKGELKSAGRIRIDGRIEGDGDIDGLVLLSRRGYWKGTVAADIVIVEGTVDGDITARSKLEVHAKAKINGRLSSPSILIQPGAQVNGDLTMRSTAALRLIEDKSRQTASSAATIEQTVEQPPRRIVGE